MMAMVNLGSLQSGLIALLIFAASGQSAAEAPALDITITVMQEGETPEDLVNRIELPALEDLDDRALEQANLPVEAGADLNSLTEEVQQTVNATVSDAIGTGQLEELAPAVKEVLDTDVIELPDEVIDQLVDDLVEADVQASSELADDLQSLETQDLGEALETQNIDDALRDMEQGDLDSMVDELPIDALEQLPESEDIRQQIDGL